MRRTVYSIDASWHSTVLPLSLIIQASLFYCAQSSVIRRDRALKLNEKLKVLFICSRNQWRSPTAEQIWRKHPSIVTRSAGTSSKARRKVSVADIQWANVILVMEQKHKSMLIAEFNRLIQGKRIHVLDIPDEYEFMDPELVVMLEQSVNSLLGLE